MGKFLKNFKSPNALLAVFIGASLVVFTAAASGSFHRSSDGGVSLKAPIQTQQQQAVPATENQDTLQSAREGKSIVQSQTIERADIPAISINNNAGTNSTSATTTHFSVSKSGGDDGSWDDNKSGATIN